MVKTLTSLAFFLIAGCGGSNDDVPPGPPTLSLVAGSTVLGMFGNVDGIGASSRFFFPTGVVSDPNGTLYVADAGNNVIRKITQDGTVSTLAGTASVTGGDDGTGALASFNNPFGIARDGNGNLYVADSFNHTIRKITPSGMVTTFAGAAGVIGSVDGIGSAARFGMPVGVAVDSLGNIFVAEFGNRTIRKISPVGLVTTFAGAPGNNSGSVDGIGNAARFNTPTGIAIDGSDNVYVIDSSDQTVRKISATGNVTTLAGSPGFFDGSVDGVGPAARFASPWGIAVDTRGNLYIADDQSRIIRKLTPDGVVTTLVGQVSAEPVFTPGLLPGSLAPRVLGVNARGSTLYITTSNAVAQVTNLP